MSMTDECKVVIKTKELTGDCSLWTDFGRRKSYIKFKEISQN